MLCSLFHSPLLSRWVLLLVLLSAFVFSGSAFAVSSTDTGGTLEYHSDCSAALVLHNNPARANSFANAMADVANRNSLVGGCFFEGSQPQLMCNRTGGGQTVAEIPYGEGSDGCFSLRYAFTHTCPDSISHPQADGLDHQQYFGDFACEMSATVVCPPNSTLDPGGTICYCNTGSVSYGSGCEAPRPDPCPAARSACATSCGGDTKYDIFQCQSDRGELVGTPYCHCESPKPPGVCDPATGADCATSTNQKHQLEKLQGIKNAIEGSTTAGKDTNDSIKNQTAILGEKLDKLLDAPGVKNAPIGGGGGSVDVNVDNSGVVSAIDGLKGEGNAISKTVSGLGDTTEATNATIEAKKLEFHAKLEEIKTGIAQSLTATAPTGNAHLPCYQNIPLVGGVTFEMCFQDYEDELSQIPLYIYGLGFLIAGFIILRRD